MEISDAIPVSRSARPEARLHSECQRVNLRRPTRSSKIMAKEKGFHVRKGNYGREI